MKLSEIAILVEDKISSNSISLGDYVTTDSLLPNKKGKNIATNLPPVACSLTHYQKGDVLVANIRPYLKKVWLADKEGGCSSDVLVFRVRDGNKNSFLYAVLLQDRFFDYAMRGAKGSKMPRGDKEQIMRYELPVFSPQEQENIGNIVISITEKLRLNRAINHNLEVMAKLFYDYWFVQFDFPNTEYKPYKSSGGTMVWNDRLNRYIPANWGVGRLGNICDILLGGTPDTRNKSFWGGSYPWLNSGEVAEFPILKSEKSITEEGLNSSATAYAPKGCVVLSITRHLRSSILAIDACINQSVVAIKQTDEMRKEYLYPLISREIPRFMLLRTGAQQPHINKETVESTWIVIPPSTILEKYYAIASPIYCSIIKNAIEIENLIKLRNELLPLLMNGQVSINYDLDND